MPSHKLAIFMAIGINLWAALQTERERSVVEQVEFFSRFYKRLLMSDVTLDHTVKILGPDYVTDPMAGARCNNSNFGLYPARAEWIPRLAREAEFVLMSDADMIVPYQWWNKIETHFTENPKLGFCAPLLSGNGFRYKLQRGEMDYQSGTEIYKWAAQPSYPLQLLPRKFVAEETGNSFDGFVVFRSAAIKECSYLDHYQFRLGLLDKGWQIGIARDVEVEHAKNRK